MNGSALSFQPLSSCILRTNVAFAWCSFRIPYFFPTGSAGSRNRNQAILTGSVQGLVSSDLGPKWMFDSDEGERRKKEREKEYPSSKIPSLENILKSLKITQF